MTLNEQEQFEAKQHEKYCVSTYCDQCGQIKYQRLRLWSSLLLFIISFGAKQIQEKKYKCRCWWEAVDSANTKRLLER